MTVGGRVSVYTLGGTELSLPGGLAAAAFCSVQEVIDALAPQLQLPSNQLVLVAAGGGILSADSVLPDALF